MVTGWMVAAFDPPALGLKPALTTNAEAMKTARTTACVCAEKEVQPTGASGVGVVQTPTAQVVSARPPSESAATLVASWSTNAELPKTHAKTTAIA